MFTEATTGASRPAPPDESVGRRLRAIIGVRESVLDWVPEERPRYTRMGAVVLITGVLSGLSMMVITSRLFTGPVSWLVALLMAVFWGFAIVMLDSWLIASLHGGRAKALVCLPRLLISVLLGLVIAEPLVILLFRPAIDQRVADLRNDELAAYTSEWRVCNPPTGIEIDTPECADRRLNLSSSLTALRTQRDGLAEQRDKLKTEVQGYLDQWNELERTARAECSGAGGAETTGVPGEGPECSRNRQSADQYRRDTKLDQRQADLAALDQRIVGLTESVKQAEASYGTQVESAIAQKVAHWRETRQTTGILEELTALGQLAEESVPVNVAHWVTRLLLVLFDCLPILTKWMSGSTAYDKRFTELIQANHRLHDKHIHRQERADADYWAARYARAGRKHRAELAEIEEAERADQRRRDRELDEEIERLSDFYRNEAT